MFEKLIWNRELAIDTLNNTFTENKPKRCSMSPPDIVVRENEKLQKLMSMYSKLRPDDNIGN